MSFFPGGHGGDRGLSLWHQWESSGHPLGQRHPGQHLQPSSSQPHGQGNMSQFMFPGLSTDGVTLVARGDRGRDQGLGVSQQLLSQDALPTGVASWDNSTFILKHRPNKVQFPMNNGLQTIKAARCSVRTSTVLLKEHRTARLSTALTCVGNLIRCEGNRLWSDIHVWAEL